MARPPIEVADVFAAHADTFLKVHGDAVSSAKRRVLRDLVACRTAALGGHLERCDNDECGHERPAYDSCAMVDLVITLGKDWAVRHIPYAKGEKKLPVVLSQSEATRLLKAVDNMKHLTMVLLGYSAGLRISEIANIQVNHIDSERMVINIRQGKGRKDRVVPLSPTLLEIARQHWLIDRPSKFLLPGKNQSRPISRTTIGNDWFFPHN